MLKRVEIWALLLLVVGILIMLNLSQREDFEDRPQERTLQVHSSYRSAPDGYKALFLTLDAMGHPVTRQTHPFGQLPPRGLLIIADPYKEPITRYERRQLMEWLRYGNHALVLLEYHAPGFYAAFEDPKPGESNDGPPPRGLLAPHSAAGEPASGSATPTAPSFLSARAQELAVKTDGRLEAAAFPPAMRDKLGTVLPLFKDAAGTVVAYSAMGDGGIIWCTSPWSFSNAGLREGQNLEFITALADLQPEAPVIFDEYHQGYGSNMTLWSMAPPLTKLGVVQLLVALLVLLITVGWRFGVARKPAEERFTRSRAEYLTSMAGLLERAEATHVVRDRLGALLRRELGRRLGVSAQATPEQFLEANAQSVLVDQVELERVLRQLLALEHQHRPDPQVMLRLANDVHKLLQRG